MRRGFTLIELIIVVVIIGIIIGILAALAIPRWMAKEVVNIGLPPVAHGYVLIDSCLTLEEAKSGVYYLAAQGYPCGLTRMSNPCDKLHAYYLDRHKEKRNLIR